jgi:hypothetical protein
MPEHDSSRVRTTAAGCHVQDLTFNQRGCSQPIDLSRARQAHLVVKGALAATLSLDLEESWSASTVATIDGTTTLALPAEAMGRALCLGLEGLSRRVIQARLIVCP